MFPSWARADGLQDDGSIQPQVVLRVVVVVGCFTPVETFAVMRPSSCDPPFYWRLSFLFRQTRTFVSLSGESKVLRGNIIGDHDEQRLLDCQWRKSAEYQYHVAGFINTSITIIIKPSQDGSSATARQNSTLP
jgi:hypothetical protein